MCGVHTAEGRALEASLACDAVKRMPACISLSHTADSYARGVEGGESSPDQYFVAMTMNNRNHPEHAHTAPAPEHQQHFSDSCHE